MWGDDPVKKARKEAAEKHEEKGRIDAKHPYNPLNKDRNRARKEAKEADKKLEEAIQNDKNIEGKK